MGVNVLSIAAPRSYVGMANNFARLVWTWRPFMDVFWAAIKSRGGVGKAHLAPPAGAADTGSASTVKHGSQAPVNCVWVSQILVGLRWVATFLQDQTGRVSRGFSR